MKKVVITGPESTGKSALSAELAKRLNTIYVPEIARNYLENLNRNYTEEDLLKIAIEQCAAEDSAAQYKPELLICDTDMLVMKIWSEVKYGRVHPFILDQYRRRTYQLTLLMNVDIPWEEDPLREHPLERQNLFEQYEKQLIDRQSTFEIISGTGSARTENALAALRKHGLLREE
jgi:NadR type nicotinamide-nucleotide adenylyltransferase